MRLNINHHICGLRQDELIYDLSLYLLSFLLCLSDSLVLPLTAAWPSGLLFHTLTSHHFATEDSFKKKADFHLTLQLAAWKRERERKKNCIYL